jgi:hypothetical protein
MRDFEIINILRETDANSEQIKTLIYTSYCCLLLLLKIIGIILRDYLAGEGTLI